MIGVRIAWGCGSRLPVCGGNKRKKAGGTGRADAYEETSVEERQGKAKRCQEREFHTRRKRPCVSSTTNLFECLTILRKRWSVKLRRYQDSLQQPGSKAWKKLDSGGPPAQH